MPPRDLYIRYSGAQQRDLFLAFFSNSSRIKTLFMIEKITELVKELNETKRNILCVSVCQRSFIFLLLFLCGGVFCV